MLPAADSVAARTPVAVLTITDRLPEELLSVQPTELDRVLPGPTLIHLPGRRAQPLFVSIMLHGNEDTGLRAMQVLLQRYRDVELPRSLSLFVGNVAAASRGIRRLDEQPDYNRIWPGGTGAGTPEHEMALAVLADLRTREPFASVDIHNNTGLNPHYACVNRLDQRFFHLATLFGRTVVYFTHPRGTQTSAFADLCPATTLECGKPGSPNSVEHAAAYVDACLHLSEFPSHPVARHDMDLFHTVAVAKVPEKLDFSFGDGNAELRFEPDLDHLNFRELPEGTRIARTGSSRQVPIQVIDERGRDIRDDYFRIRDGELRTTRPVMPAMLTVNAQAIRQDCLCYLMERLPIPD
jgi:succinylglutamate desuccinylase